MMRFLLLAVFAMLVCISQLEAKPKKSLHVCKNSEIERDSRLRSAEAKACLDKFMLENKETWLGCGPGSDVSCCEGDPPGKGVAICDPLP